MPGPHADFVFAVCQPGAEAALKAEVARAHPAWRFAFSRPGLVTWRTGASIGADVALGAVFARAFGASVGRSADEGEAAAAAVRLVAAGGGPLVPHVFVRELHDSAGPGPHGDPAEGEGDAGFGLAAEVRGRLLAAAPPGTFVTEPRPPRIEELVLDVIAAPGEPLWLGFHAHGPAHSPHPGGRPPLRLPQEAPSRAWLKIEEAIAWSGLPLRAGEVAVEIGSAPGGASWALLQRGLTVVGVDPGAMDPRVLAAPRFSHVQVPLGDLRREALPARVDWLLLDVNLAPQVALHGVRRIVSLLRDTLRGVIFTLKLNDWQLAAAVPALCARVAGMGLVDVRATQLPANRREICVVATAPAPRQSAPRPPPGRLALRAQGRQRHPSLRS